MEKSEKRCMIYYTLFSVLHFSLKNIEQHYSLKKSACSIFKLPLSDIFKNCTPVSRTRWVQFAFLYNNYLILQPHYNGQSLLVSSKGQKIHLLFFEIIFADSVSLFYFEILLPTTYNLNIS